MPKLRPLPRAVLLVLALVFAASTALYSALWIYAQRRQSPVQLGFDTEYVAAQHSQLVKNVNKDSPAERSGLRAGDQILKVDGDALENSYSMSDIWSRHRPGDTVELTIQRPGSLAPLLIKAVFRAPPSPEGRLSEHLGRDIINTFPLAFLVVGLTVLFLRLDDPRAWLLALMFAGAIAVPNFSNWGALGPSLRKFAMADRAIFNGFNPALFYLFFAVFPARSPIDRRVPWLKWVGSALGLSMALPGLNVGAYQTPAVVARLLGQGAADLVRLSYGYGFMTLGLLSLVGNALGASTPEAKRKIRVILWGTLVGVVPIMLALGAQEISAFHLPLWLAAVLVLLLYLFPLSFAYAVVKHRVLEIPVFLRRGARYLLVQRGFTILLTVLSAAVTLLFALSFASYLEPLTGATLPVGIALGTGFGSLLLWTGTRVHVRVGGQIDRAFFRGAYDARQILESLAEETRRTIRREELAALLGGEISQALHPISVIVFLEGGDGRLRVERDTVPPRFEPLPPDLPLLLELARRAEPLEVPPPEASGWASEEDLAAFGDQRPECLVPMLARDAHLNGLLVLGSRLSEEPYSREDKRLLAAAANQAGVTLESMRLAEQMAEKMEAERRSALEMNFAKEVQARLFPQRIAPVETLEYQGGCLQAREVGGDYYDFLDLGPGRVGLVLADVAGKGFSAALMMANLQANMRSQYGAAIKDLPGLLHSVNRLFYESTPPSHYATLFFGDYEDTTRLMRYANCGHNPPMLLRENGSLERLGATGTVLGLFEGWQCSLGETPMAPGDTLVIFSDGVTEAESDDGEFFGESRLLETLTANRHLPVPALLDAIIRTVVQFSGREQEDDLTLVVARAR
jgi:sigma-B regulation protein RsbU (phosphoserine phosphatase)